MKLAILIAQLFFIKMTNTFALSVSTDQVISWNCLIAYIYIHTHSIIFSCMNQNKFLLKSLKILT